MQSAKTSSQAHSPRSELGVALRACRSAFIGVGVMSFAINILYLTGSFFMLEIYDRVLPSRSIPTLVGLIVLAGGLYVVQGILDLIRGRILIRIGSTLDEMLSRRVYDIVVRMPLLVGNRSEGLNRCAISITSGRSCQVWGRARCSICRGCRSISRSVSRFIR